MGTKKRIFLSYDYTKDHDLKNNFIYQANDRGLPCTIEDFSLQEDHLDPKWKAKARTQIKRCDLVIVLIGADTHSSSGIKTEISLARELNKTVIQVLSTKRNYTGVVGIQKSYPWKWKVLEPLLVSI